MFIITRATRLHEIWATKTLKDTETRKELSSHDCTCTARFLDSSGPIYGFAYIILHISHSMSIRIKIVDFFVPCDHWVWWIVLKNNRAPLLCYVKLCAYFCSPWWIKTGVTVRKLSIMVKFYRWRWKTTGLLFYASSSVVHPFKPLVYSSWSYSPVTAKLGQIGDVLSRLTLKFDEFPCKTKWHFSYAISSFVYHFNAICEFKME